VESLLIRQSLPQDIEPLYRNILAEDKEDLLALGHAESDIPQVLSSALTGRKCFTGISTFGELTCLFSLMNTVETCDVTLNNVKKTLLYMPIWFIGTTRLLKYHDIFIQKFKYCIEEIEEMARGVPIGNWLGVNNEYRVSWLHWFGFEFVKHEQMNNVPFMLYARI
jgi:hypothetical protein